MSLQGGCIPIAAHPHLPTQPVQQIVEAQLLCLKACKQAHAVGLVGDINRLIALESCRVIIHTADTVTLAQES